MRDGMAHRIGFPAPTRDREGDRDRRGNDRGGGREGVRHKGGGMEAAGEVLGPPRGFEREGIQGAKGDRRAGRPIERENCREEKEGEEAK